MKRLLTLAFAVGWLGTTMVRAQGAGPRRPPNYSQQNMPVTTFSCRDKILGGYYSDPETDCQMFHVCVKVPGQGIQDYKFLCPNDTAFDQENQICDDWFNIDCEASTLYYSDNFDLYRIGSDFEGSRVGPVAKLPTNNINNAVSDTGDDDYLRRADRGESVNNDLLRGSHSSNFFSNKNQGREDEEEEIKKKPSNGKSGVRKLLTGKRPVTSPTNNATPQPTQAASVDPVTQRQNLAGRNRAASNYRGSARSYNNNFKNNNYENNGEFNNNNNNYNNNYNNNNYNQQQVTSPPDSQRLNYNTAAPVTQRQQNYYTTSAPVTQRQQNYYTTSAPVTQRQQNYYTTSAPVTQRQQNYYTTTAAPQNVNNNNNNNYYTSTQRPTYYTSPASSPFSTQKPNTYTAPSSAAKQNYYTAAPSVAANNYYTAAPAANTNQQNYYNSPAAQQVTGATATGFDNQKFYNNPTQYNYQTTTVKNYQNYQTTVPPTVYPDQATYNAANHNYETAKLFKSIVAAQNNQNRFNNNDDEFLKTAPSQNLGAANFNRVQNIYKFNTSVAASYSTGTSNSSTARPQNYNFVSTSPNYYSTTQKPYNPQNSYNGTTRNYNTASSNNQNYNPTTFSYSTTARPTNYNYQTSPSAQPTTQNYYNEATTEVDFTKAPRKFQNPDVPSQNRPRGFGKVTSKNAGQKKYTPSQSNYNQAPESQSNYNQAAGSQANYNQANAGQSNFPKPNYNQAAVSQPNYNQAAGSQPNYNQATSSRGTPLLDKTEKPRPFTTTSAPVTANNNNKEPKEKEQYDYAYYDDSAHNEYDNVDGLEFVKTKTRQQK
ncbi:Chitin Hypothetical protein Peritrophin-A domain [Nesidiocoris tenuis]|uniref:Chitin-binding type-2 domain-containing protein n=1 Tax=Nesidiocoris tenuis TaxID=355587 RepID=A0ABN7BF69_9HEMI|nr:Chitin Hypothetical protein Peritrophin-A domain [Nesidiocoris tenuis]